MVEHPLLRDKIGLSMRKNMSVVRRGRNNQFISLRKTIHVQNKRILVRIFYTTSMPSRELVMIPSTQCENNIVLGKNCKSKRFETEQN